MMRPHALRAIACFLLASVSVGRHGSGAALADETTRLTPAQVLEREMGAGETHRYSFELRAGEYLQLLVEQYDVDVAQTLTGPDGAVILETDCPSQFLGPDPLAFVAAQSGIHELALKADSDDSPPRGRYEIRLEAIREPSSLDLMRVKAVQAGAEGLRFFRKDPRVALERYSAALQGWKELGDRRMQMWTELVVGVLTAAGSDEYQQALEIYRRPLATALELGDEYAEARVRYNMGQALRWLGELDEGRMHLDRALAIHRSAGRPTATARVLGALGTYFAFAGEPQQALDTLFEALRIFQAAGNVRSEAATRTYISSTYLRLGDPELALEHLRIALPAFANEPPFRASTIIRIGQAHFQMGDFVRAREAYSEALGMYKTLGNRIYEADTYLGLGDLHQEEGDLRAAAEVFASALAVYHARAYPLGEGAAQCRLGEVHRHLGDLPAARAAFEAALAVAPRASAAITACAEAGLARVDRDAGDLDAARGHAETALARAESLRANVVSPHTRAAALASHQSLYEVLIDTLMRQHARAPSAGRDVDAFEVSERARARSLLELLGEGRVDVRQGVDPELLAEERSLQRRLNSKAQEQTQALVAGRAERGESLGRDMDSLAARLAEVEARIRSTSPQYAALTQPQPLTLATIRAQVLDADTQLLQYTLGEARSYLWVVSPTRLESFALAPRAEIERAARHLHGLVSAPGAGTIGAGASEAALREASRLLLAPAAGALVGKRLLVVTPGALQYVPFASLPLPAGPPGPLVSRFELVSAPSASVIATLRSESRGRRPAAKTAAVFADPVFEDSDPRLAAAQRTRPAAGPVQLASRGADPPGALESALVGVRGSAGGLGRLPFSRQEAAEIAALASSGQVLTATGFAANLAAVTSPQLAEYRIVHFATHGVLNTRRPELSGVVLSLLDRAGRKQDGFLRLHDVYNLKLAADLVVLSGCQTALGKDLGGEGLVGLTRGFMYAGARRVVASLWQVDDESTAELMKRFYRGMLKEGRRPADALRIAQLEMSRDRRWSAPFYWAGFVLQGEWR